ncbi:hypothetical protein Hanom_Chr02g00165041 [Helianthus anomalus]
MFRKSPPTKCSTLCLNEKSPKSTPANVSKVSLNTFCGRIASVGMNRMYRVTAAAAKTKTAGNNVRSERLTIILVMWVGSNMGLDRKRVWVKEWI